MMAGIGLQRRSVCRRGVWAWLAPAVVAAVAGTAASAQIGTASQPDGATIQGTVLDESGQGVSGARVTLEQIGFLPVDAMTGLSGVFTFHVLSAQNYRVSASKDKLHSCPIRVDTGDKPETVVTLSVQTTGCIRADAGVNKAVKQPMEFADQPDFSVAGVTDWTAVGGHGSDSTLRASEDLAHETLTLKPESSAKHQTQADQGSEREMLAAVAASPDSFSAKRQLGSFYLRAGDLQKAKIYLQGAYFLNPKDKGNEYDLATALKGGGELPKAREHVNHLLASTNSAAFLRLAGEIDEGLGDSLSAVQHDAEAARLDPSEENYFSWGSELLIHRAIWQAADVFRNGAKAHPGSARMLTGLGAALFAGARYDEAASRLCAAADLNPGDAEPYTFMGRIEIEAPKPLPCIENKLGRWAQQKPGSALANYLYAMAILKTRPIDEDALQQAETLLMQAIKWDPHCADAYLELGILHARKHDYGQAMTFYKDALGANPDLAEAHYRLGVAYDRTGDGEKAKQEFRLHDEMAKTQAEERERERRQVKQFLIVLQRNAGSPIQQDTR